MKTIMIIILCVTVTASCSKKDGFFSEMPSSYDGSVLDDYGDLISNLRTKVVLDGDGLDVSCLKCEEIIHFCGVLTYRNDTIFYSNNSDQKRKVFFVLGEKKFSQWVVEYSLEKSDSITFVGKSYRKESNDSVYVYEFKSAKRWSQPADAPYLKYISIKRGGIKQFGFHSGSGKTVVIDLLERPRSRIL
jgi:hypothetical protein